MVAMRKAKSRGRVAHAPNPAGLPRRSGAARQATGKSTSVRAGGGKAATGRVAPGVLK
jgi:hypothetical protein